MPRTEDLPIYSVAEFNDKVLFKLLRRNERPSARTPGSNHLSPLPWSPLLISPLLFPLSISIVANHLFSRRIHLISRPVSI